MEIHVTRQKFQNQVSLCLIDSNYYFHSTKTVILKAILLDYITLYLKLVTPEATGCFWRPVSAPTIGKHGSNCGKDKSLDQYGNNETSFCLQR